MQEFGQCVPLKTTTYLGPLDCLILSKGTIISQVPVYDTKNLTLNKKQNKYILDPKSNKLYYYITFCDARCYLDTHDRFAPLIPCYEFVIQNNKVLQYRFIKSFYIVDSWKWRQCRNIMERKQKRILEMMPRAIKKEMMNYINNIEMVDFQYRLENKVP